MYEGVFMKKIIFILLGIFSSCGCTESAQVKRIFFEGHSYLDFTIHKFRDYNDHQIIHDPDCGCSDRWIKYDIEGTGTSEIKRIKPSHHD